MIPLAHAGHFIAIPIYMAPVILLVLWFKLGERRERRRQRRSERPRG